MKITIPGCMDITVSSKRWYILRLKPGMAETALASVREAGYDVYLPRRRFDKHNRRLRVMVERSEPLMPGYMFVVHPRPGGVLDDWDEIRACDGVSGPLKGTDGPLRIPDAIVQEVMTHEFQSVRGELKKVENRFPVGEKFWVTEGPFSSFVAEVAGYAEQDRIRALIEIFGRFTAMEIDSDFLAPIKGKRPPSAA